MELQLTGRKRCLSGTKQAADEAALSLKEELVAAIHGAFEVAVEIAVQEVTKLVGQATGDVYEEMRRENESLRQRLQRAEAMLDCARQEEGGGSCALTKHLLDATDQTDLPLHRKCTQKSPDRELGNVHRSSEVIGDAGGRSRADPHQKHVIRNGEQKTQHVSDAATNTEENSACVVAALTLEVGDKMSHAYAVKVESTNPPCRLAAQDHSMPPPPSRDDKTASEQVTVKQEKPEEGTDGSACCSVSIKVEDFSSECMLSAQSKMLEEWKPEELDIQNQNSNSHVSCTRLSQAHPENVTSNIPPPTDHPSLSSEFPNIFQLAEPAPLPETSPQVYGVHVRSSCNPGHPVLYACKSCGQTFHLPSLLRRHYGQCQQKLQQCCRQPAAGSRRTRLQLYPPGCSPFRCMECNREFNRMENLKTHLRIHTGERPYTCTVCSMCFRHSGALTRHFRIHTGEKPYICGQCGKSFRNCGGLKFHQRSHSKQLQESGTQQC